MQMEQKFVDIPRDQVTLTRSPKGKSLGNGSRGVSYMPT